MEDQSLALIDAVRVALEKATSAQDVITAIAKANAAEVYFKQVKAGQQIEVKAQEYSFRAQKKLGQMLEAGKAEGLISHAHSKSNQHGSFGVIPNSNNSKFTLKEAGINPKLSSIAQKLAKIPELEFERGIEEGKKAGKISIKNLLNPDSKTSAPKERDKEPLVIDLYNQGVPLNKIAVQAGIHRRTVGDIVREIKIRAEEREKLPEITPDMLSKMSDRQKVQTAINQQIKKLEAEYRIKIDEEIKRIVKLKIEKWQKEQDEAKLVMKGRQGFMTRVIYRKILACLHPDWVTDEKQKRRYEEAFNEFSKLEKCILNEKESPTTFRDFPKTPAEWEAIRRKHEAERKTTRTNKQTDLVKR